MINVPELPERYEKDLLQLMARDAHTLYVYWEISNRRRWLAAQHFQTDWHNLPKVLRVYDVTNVYFNGNNANGYFDIETTPESCSWYINGAGAGATYMVDFGTYTWNRQFVPLVRSNFVALPRATAPAYGEPVVAAWPTVHPYGQRVLPHLFENIQTLAQIKKGGIRHDDEQNTAEADLQRVYHPGATHASALHSPS
ncbi:hypothetical protein FHS18_000617 [Paenibacillus phyllosphaerae]|uniref:DUF4912 domain-containing protein n=1 Tax=Paenibacillus phyllosphaerae TaxID=274593 RepID=A0A7W5ATN7_9BACL|nr:DUF4912 domain-containing protein [Paenibacillus phyllosphaerae]MBB3108589.1 hypothetical protein [Paenibacillus phyllosphaerae]